MFVLLSPEFWIRVLLALYSKNNVYKIVCLKKTMDKNNKKQLTMWKVNVQWKVLNSNFLLTTVKYLLDHLDKAVLNMHLLIIILVNMSDKRNVKTVFFVFVFFFIKNHLYILKQTFQNILVLIFIFTNIFHKHFYSLWKKHKRIFLIKRLPTDYQRLSE